MPNGQSKEANAAQRRPRRLGMSPARIRARIGRPENARSVPVGTMPPGLPLRREQSYAGSGKKRRRPPLRNKPFAQAVTETPAAGRHGQTIARRTKCRSDSHRKAGRLHGIPYRAILRNLLFFKTGIAGALSAKRTETGAPNAPQNAGRTVRTIGRKDPN